MEGTFEKMMEGSGRPPSLEISTFSQIRRNLDSAYSYLVFESISLTDEADGFKEICAALSAPDSGVLDQTFYRDRETTRLLLVARLSPDSDQMWTERMLNDDLPGRINFYFYGKSG